MKTEIKAKKNLYNQGKCFTKGRSYFVNGSVINEAGLMDKITTNDMGEAHKIGSFWRDFEIVE